MGSLPDAAIILAFCFFPYAFPEVALFLPREMKGNVPQGATPCTPRPR